MKQLHIISWANSELAKPEIEKYIWQSNSQVIALFNKNKIQVQECVHPVQVDLTLAESTQKIKNYITKILTEDISTISLQHFIWKFKYEPNWVQNDNDWDWIDDEIYTSNTQTFINLINALDDVIWNKQYKVKIQSIWALSDDNPNNHNWPSFNKSKTRIKDACALLSSRYDNVYSHMISTSTINTGNERKLRPFVSQIDYWHRLSVDEFWEQAHTIRDTLHLANSSQFIEQRIIKAHPDYHRFLMEDKIAERVRRDKEIWVKR